MNTRTRCPWALHSDLEKVYHDEEWGVPCYDDRKIFSFLILEAAQAGLSWLTILRKREGYRRCFADFSPEAVAAFTPNDVEGILGDASIVRNRKKIEAAVNNARIFCELAARHGSFSRFIWDFVDGRPIQNAWKEAAEVPPLTPLSERMAREFKKLGFAFLGPTVIYAHMQATGMVNDHLVSCFRHREVRG